MNKCYKIINISNLFTIRKSLNSDQIQSAKIISHILSKLDTNLETKILLISNVISIINKIL